MQLIAHPMQSSSAVHISTANTSELIVPEGLYMDIRASINIQRNAWGNIYAVLFGNMDLKGSALTNSRTRAPTTTDYRDSESFVQSYNRSMPVALQLNTRFSYLLSSVAEFSGADAVSDPRVVVKLLATASVISDTGAMTQATYDIMLDFMRVEDMEMLTHMTYFPSEHYLTAIVGYMFDSRDEALYFLKGAGHVLLYMIQVGDTLGQIAEFFKMEAKHLAAANHHFDRNDLVPGQLLKIYR